MGCSIGCKECDGGAQGGSNPSTKDRCPQDGPKKTTITKPEHRTVNREAEALSAEDWSKYNPWRAPGSAPVYDPCGRASGGPHATSGHGEFTNTTHNNIGDMGSKLPKMPTGVRCGSLSSSGCPCLTEARCTHSWKAGSTVETLWSLRANQ